MGGGRHALLLTATVAPGDIPALRLRDPEQREAQYLEALAHWCKSLPAEWGVVVAENSGWPSARFVELGESLGRRIEVLECEDRGSAQGKSVGEANLLDDFASSDVSRQWDWIFKCTGRLYVKNLESSLPRLAGRKGICAAIVPSLDHMDSRFFGASTALFHEYFTNMASEIDEDTGERFENVAARRMLRALGDGHAFIPFEVLPYVAGRSATLDTDYDGFSVPLKRAVRERVRRTMMEREILI